METLQTTVKTAAANGGFDPSSVKVLMSSTAPAPVSPRRYLDPHSIRHAKLPKAALAIAGAEVLDGRLQLLNPTLEMVATAVGVSKSYVAAACKLTPQQREEVLCGKRPLVRPSPSAPVLSVEQRFTNIVVELGGIAPALDARCGRAPQRRRQRS
jgi:hypothetical protein